MERGQAVATNPPNSSLGDLFFFIITKGRCRLGHRIEESICVKIWFHVISVEKRKDPTAALPWGSIHGLRGVLHPNFTRPWIGGSAFSDDRCGWCCTAVFG
jgi:hypothetical protein